MTGTVVTFYSYKGGVGRSFALANTAARLCSWGAKVLCLDWDLDAPGLQHYFSEWIREPIRGGLAEAFTKVQGGRELSLGEYAVPLRHPWNRGAIDLVAAGATSEEEYVKRIQRLDWSRLYKEHDLGAQLERLRRDWVTEYDFVLVDSRTGITDIGGICTAHLPDIVVLVFTANEQSLRGVLDVARRADRARDKLPYDLSKLLLLPVPSRFDAREEKVRADRWQGRFIEDLAPLVAPWLHRQVPVKTLIDHVTVPYVAYWSFGEEIAAGPDTRPAPGDIVYQLDVVAALLAHGLDRTELLDENRDLYLAGAARAARRLGPTFEYDAQLTYPPEHEPLARRLSGLLLQEGITVHAAPAGGESSAGWAVADNCRHLIALVDDDPRSAVRREVETFLRRVVDELDRRQVFPVLLEGAVPLSLPVNAASTEPLRMRVHALDALAGEIAAAVHVVEGRQRYLDGAMEQAGEAAREAARHQYGQAVDRAARLALEQQAPDRAEAYLRQMLADDSMTGDTRARANALRLQGTVDKVRGDVKSAKVHYLDALSAAYSDSDVEEQVRDLVELATLSLLQDDFSSAQDYYQEAIGVASGRADQLLAPVHRAFADLLTRRGDRDGAEEHLERALHLSEEHGDHAGEALALKLLGDFFLDIQPNTAHDYYRRSLALHEQLGDTASSAATHVLLGQLHAEQGEDHAAEAEYRLALTVSEQSGDAAGAASALIQLAVLAAHRNGVPEALDHLQRALQLSEGANDKQAQAEILTSLAGLQEATGDLVAAEEGYHRAFEVSIGVEDQARAADVQERLGLLAQRRGNYSDAQQHLRQALALRQRLSDRAGVARTHVALGSLEIDLGQYASAGRRLRDALHFFESTYDRRNFATTLLQLGALAERARQDFDEADRHYHRALETAEEIKDFGLMAAACERLGALEEQRQNPAVAREYYGRGLELSRRAGARRTEATIQARLGDVFVELGHAHQASESYEGAQRIFVQLGDLASAASVLARSARLAAAVGDDREGMRLQVSALAMQLQIHAPPVGDDLGPLARLRQTLGEDEFRAVLHDQLDDEAVRYVLGRLDEFSRDRA